MAVYDSTEQFYAVMKDVFDQVMQHPDHIESFTRSNLVIRMSTTDPDAEILLDGRQPPLEVFFGERPGRANLEISLEADLLHAMWLGVESTQQAFLTGRIRTRGNLLKAMQLVELFAEAERIYPAVAQQYGLPGA
ncbi:MAG: SCP2 sterol-binding domain-containing protein [Caldilinea sp.]|nr:SCP2 sterol-binding domain-containing protein [Caldilineaceae bacterium]MCO5210683.1 SCP2 sterol-binding domain-containing protein [Caldilinea sp.]MCW5841296.1 SCP2 sterol-binding domain-containing protein [Caldilinea sp.]